MQRIASIFLLGAYGQDNLGDETILEVFLEFFKNCNIFVASSNPRKTQRKFYVNTVHSYGEYQRMLKFLLMSDFVIFGGGSLLKELCANVGRWRYSVLVNVLVGVSLAKLMRKKVIFSAIGVGPLKSSLSRILAKLSIKFADLVTVRDNGSKILLRNIGVKRKIIVVADPAFLVKSQKQKSMKERRRRGRLTVAICPLYNLGDKASYENLVHVTSKFCEYLIETHNAQIFLVPFQSGYNPYNDARVNEDIFKRVRDKFKLKILKIEGTDSADMMLRLFASVDILVGVRLHSLIFALLTSVPFLAIIHDEKVKNFLMDINWKHSINAEELRLDELIEKFERLLKGRMEILKEMENLKILMTRRAMLNFHLLRQFIKKRKWCENYAANTPDELKKPFSCNS